MPGLSGYFTSIKDRLSSGLYLAATRDMSADARDQSDLTAVAQETADQHNRIDLVLSEP